MKCFGKTRAKNWVIAVMFKVRNFMPPNASRHRKSMELSVMEESASVFMNEWKR